MTVKEFIGDRVIYDKEGQMIFGMKGDNPKLILEVRGVGAIQNSFRKGGDIDFEAANKFQDEMGKFIANCINEKLNQSNP